MGASYGKLTPGHEEAIYALRKAKKTGREIRQALARGVPGEPPVSISADRALKVAKRLSDERDELYAADVQRAPAPEGLRLLTRRLVLVATRETERLERAERAGRLDANKLGKLAGALTKLHVLLERNDELGGGAEPVKKGGSSQPDPDAPPAPSTFGESLISNEGGSEDDGDAESQPAPIADRVVPGPAPVAA